MLMSKFDKNYASDFNQKYKKWQETLTQTDRERIKENIIITLRKLALLIVKTKSRGISD